MKSWIAEAVGKMHIHKLAHKDVAAEIGVSPEYLSMILNGKRDPKSGEHRVMSAIDRLIAKVDANL